MFSQKLRHLSNSFFTASLLMAFILTAMITHTSQAAPSATNANPTNQPFIVSGQAANTAATALASVETITDPGQGVVVLPAGTPGADQLSGITYKSGTDYLAVSDNVSGGAKAFTVTININTATGQIQGSPIVDAAINLAAGADPEGIAYVAADSTFFVSDETGPAMRQFNADGTLASTVSVPSVFSSIRANLSLESAALGPDDNLWTANEESLSSDGPVSSFTDGTIIRIQRFDNALNPSGQWGYITDPISGDIIGSSPGRGTEERSGVADLVMLPNGKLLVLERSLGGDPGNFNLPIFRSSIYEVDFTGATDTSAMSNLSVGGFTEVSKTLLWQEDFSAVSTRYNFEGITVGPVLDDGRYSLLLISDDGSGAEQTLYPLIVTVSTSQNNWLGHTNDWEVASNWSRNLAPTLFDSVVITNTPTGGNMPILTDNAAVWRLDIGQGASLNLDSFTLSVEDALTNTGTLSQTLPVTGVGTGVEFLHITDQAGSTDNYFGMVITPTAASMGSVRVGIKGNQSQCTTNGGDQLLTRCFRITPSVVTAAAIKFYFSEAERNGQSANSLILWHYDGPPGSWSNGSATNSYRYSETGAACLSPICWFEAADVNQYSPFTGGGSVPTAVSLQNISAYGTRGNGLVLMLLLSPITWLSTFYYAGKEGCHETTVARDKSWYNMPKLSQGDTNEPNRNIV